MTEKDYINSLLERYMAASTTEAEERALEDFFCSKEQVEPAWEPYWIMFNGMAQCRRRSAAKPKHTIVSLRWVVGVAASVLLALSFYGIATYLNSTDNKPQIVQTKKQELPQFDKKAVEVDEIIESPVEHSFPDAPKVLEDDAELPSEQLPCLESDAAQLMLAASQEPTVSFEPSGEVSVAEAGLSYCAEVSEEVMARYLVNEILTYAKSETTLTVYKL